MKQYSFVFMLFFLFCGCKKEEVDTSIQQLDIEEVRNYIKGEDVFYRITNLTEKVWKEYDVDSLKKAQFSIFSDTSVKISYVTDTNKITRLVLNYGTKGFIDTDGLKKKGKISFLFTGKYNELNSSCVIELTDYYQDTIAVRGKNTIKFLENDTLSSKIEGGQLIFSSSKTANWNSQRKRVSQKDAIYFYGTANGKSSSGIDYKIQIDENNPEVVLPTCSLIPVKGNLTVTFPTKMTSRFVDYGQSDCNQEVTITIGQLIYSIILE